ncbi:hypothetical protein M9H77_23198 [Catharanthus roseus]|uniref:Uncharacterized protein n=1 Tax=Catharanthus roseus TaxID=4058 RepID=A0ACC0AUC3_CATRO|nr:hypothetical protein M9H77_23198 [Catharanthus roseus]
MNKRLNPETPTPQVTPSPPMTMVSTPPTTLTLFSQLPYSSPTPMTSASSTLASSTSSMPASSSSGPPLCRQLLKNLQQIHTKEPLNLKKSKDPFVSHLRSLHELLKKITQNPNNGKKIARESSPSNKRKNPKHNKQAKAEVCLIDLSFKYKKSFDGARYMRARYRPLERNRPQHVTSL